MSVAKPTKEELNYWESQLKNFGLSVKPHKTYSPSLPEDFPARDSLVPARPISPGSSLLDRERMQIFDRRQDRKRRPKKECMCICGKVFRSRTGTKYCGMRCKEREKKRNQRAKVVPSKLPIVSEGAE